MYIKHFALLGYPFGGDIRRTASACSSAAKPSCGAASAWPCTRRSTSASSSDTTCPR